ncbi:hypothetical protein EVAR_86035_1 [Eumeta japonica]|uniref:Uncharacterized protein n=1 Tax=Eumeta variegata TaxID=151549 RepID=A0A4C1UJ84_EUMVA|nr:hypothetical protein EVAR_86035_1 [Eumeta japonica]
MSYFCARVIIAGVAEVECDAFVRGRRRMTPFVRKTASLLVHLFDPVLAIAEHRYVERGDGRRDAQCLTQAGSFWPIFFYVMIIIFLFLLPLIILVILYSVIAKI